MAAALLIVSALLHAIWNSTIKKSSSPEAQSFLILLCAALMNLFVSVVFEGQIIPARPAILWTAAAGFCEGCYFYSLAKTYASGSFGLSYALMRGGAMCLVWLISSFFLNERLLLLQLPAVAALFYGMHLISSAKNRALSREGRNFALMNACFIAGYHICYAEALANGSEPAGTFGSAMFFVALPLFLSLNIRAGGAALFPAIRSLAGREMRNAVFGGLACGISFFLFLVGLKTISPGLAISLRNTSVAFGALLGMRMKEELTRKEKSGIALVFAGAVALPLIA